MGTVMDLAIALTLKDALTGQIGRIINSFRQMEGVTDEVRAKLDSLNNIAITGGILAGAGVAGLKTTLDMLSDAVDEAANLESKTLTTTIKAFGQGLAEVTKEERQLMQQVFEDKSLDVSLATHFNSSQIAESMTALIKGGMDMEQVVNGAAEANAYFAQINEILPQAAANGTAKFAAGFGLINEEIMEGMDLVTKYSDATIADALAMQQNIGNAAAVAAAAWKGKDKLEIAEQTIQLVAATKYMAGDEAAAATYTKRFIDEASKFKEGMSSKQIKLMEQAGWLDSQGHSIFIDYDTGMVKDAYELEKILENAAERLSNVEFTNLVDTVFGEQGKRTAMVLAQKGDLDLATIKEKADNQLGIQQQVDIQMDTFNAQKGIFEEAKNTLKATLGKPFLDVGTNFYRGLVSVLTKAADFFRNHPEVVKWAAALATVASSALILIGVLTMLTAGMSALKLVWGIAGKAMLASWGSVMSAILPIVAIVAVLGVLAYTVYKNWDTLGPQFSGIFDRIKLLLDNLGESFRGFGSMLVPILSQIGELITAAVVWTVENAVPYIEIGLDIVIAAFQAAGAVISAAIAVIQFVLNGLSIFWQNWGDTIKIFISGVWEFFVEFTTTKFELISKIIKTVLEYIADLFKIITAIINGDWEQAWKLAQEAFGRFKDNILGIADFIGDKLKGLADKAKNWGSNLIKSFMDGIKGRHDELGKTMQKTSTVVKDYIGVESPTKKGPLMRNHLWGGNLVQSFADGMTNHLRTMEQASQAASKMVKISGSVSYIADKLPDAEVMDKVIQSDVIIDSKINKAAFSAAENTMISSAVWENTNMLHTSHHANTFNTHYQEKISRISAEYLRENHSSIAHDLNESSRYDFSYLNGYSSKLVNNYYSDARKQAVQNYFDDNSYPVSNSRYQAENHQERFHTLNSISVPHRVGSRGNAIEQVTIQIYPNPEHDEMALAQMVKNAVENLLNDRSYPKDNDQDLGLTFSMNGVRSY